MSELCAVRRHGLSAGGNPRLPRGADYASSVPADLGGAGATAVLRISIVKGDVTVGVGFLVNINHTTTPGQGLLDFMDMNGDRYPDIFSTYEWSENPWAGHALPGILRNMDCILEAR